MTPPRVAVLGGTGWVGRHVCAGFVERGHDVVAIARKPAAHLPGSHFQVLDLASTSEDEIAGLLRSERIGILVNATDATNATDGWDRTDAELDAVNVAAVKRLLAAAGSLPWPVKVVQLGTIHEYGPVASGTAISESQPARPANSYARSKLGGSEAVLGVARAGTGDGVVLRLVNVCGPHPEPHSFPGKLLRLLKDAGDGQAEVTITDARRDFVDVRDVAEAVVAAAGKPVSGQVINIGSGVAVEIRELVRTFADEAGFSSRLAIHDGPVRSIGGEWILADITLAEKLLGWRPRIDLRQSLRDMWLAG